MSGNVWEWTNDASSSSLIYYLKGGSWYDDASQSTASAAFDDLRWLRFNFNGFRVVVVPISR